MELNYIFFQPQKQMIREPWECHANKGSKGNAPTLYSTIHMKCWEETALWRLRSNQLLQIPGEKNNEFLKGNGFEKHSGNIQ